MGNVNALNGPFAGEENQHVFAQTTKKRGE